MVFVTLAENLHEQASTSRMVREDNHLTASCAEAILLFPFFASFSICCVHGWHLLGSVMVKPTAQVLLWRLADWPLACNGASAAFGMHGVCMREGEYFVVQQSQY